MKETYCSRLIGLKSLLASYLTLIGLLLFLSSASSQHNSFDLLPDAVKKEVEVLKSELEQAQYLLQTIESTPIEQSKLMTNLADACLEIAKANDFKLEAAKANFWRIASNYENRHYSDENILNVGELNKLLYVFEQAALPIWEARTKMVLSNTHYYLGNDSMGLAISKELMEQLEDFDSRNNALLFGDAYKNRGNLFWGKNLDTTILNYEKAYRYYELDSIRLKSKLILLNINLAITSLVKNNYKQSITYCDQALSLCDSNDSTSLARVHLDCAHIITEQGLNRKDIQLFKISNEKLQQAINYGTPELSRAYYQLGANTQNIAIYAKTLDSITYDELLKKAAYYYLQAITNGTDEGNKEVYINVFDAAVQLTENEMENSGVVRGGKIIMSAISDAYLTTYEKADTLNQQQIQLNTELNELKLATERRKRGRSILLLSLVAVGLLGIVTAIYLWQRNKTIQQNFEIRLEALRSQINSHFISNALNAIDLLIMEGNKNDASRYIVDLHRLVRMILDSSKKTLISLEREVDILKRYLKLEKLRLGERINIEWDIDQRINLANCQVPPLILQPFVENAIWHGILNKDNNESGIVQITMEDQGEMIECNIQDDGVGRKRASELKAEAALEFQSLGMKITNERIDALKKIKDASIETIDLYHDNGESAGTKIVIRLPKLV